MRRSRPALLVPILLTAALLGGCGGGSNEEQTSTKPFEPSASLRAIGGTTRTKKPDIVLRVTARNGDDNIRSVSVSLPPVLLVDTSAVGELCTRAQLEASRCAGHEPLGAARVISTAFSRPLSGPVYVVSGYGREFGLAYVLGGPAKILLKGRVAFQRDGGVRAGVEDIPNTPIESFELTIKGGPRGDMVLSRSICASVPVAEVRFTGQEGATHEERVPLEGECG